MGESLQKYYWMSYECSDAGRQFVSIQGMAISKHPLLVLADLNRPPTPPSSTSPQSPYYYHSITYRLILWQEITLEEYELARQYGMSDAPIERPKDEPYR